MFTIGLRLLPVPNRWPPLYCNYALNLGLENFTPDASQKWPLWPILESDINCHKTVAPKSSLVTSLYRLVLNNYQSLILRKKSQNGKYFRAKRAKIHFLCNKGVFDRGFNDKKRGVFLYLVINLLWKPQTDTLKSWTRTAYHYNHSNGRGEHGKTSLVRVIVRVIFMFSEVAKSKRSVEKKCCSFKDNIGFMSIKRLFLTK